MPKKFYKLLQLNITQMEAVYYSIDIRGELIEFILLSGKYDLIQVMCCFLSLFLLIW